MRSSTATSSAAICSCSPEKSPTLCQISAVFGLGRQGRFSLSPELNVDGEPSTSHVRTGVISFGFHKPALRDPCARMLRPGSCESGDDFGRKSSSSPLRTWALSARLRAWRVPGWRSGRPKPTTQSVVCGAPVSSSSGVFRARREGIQDAIPGTGGPMESLFGSPIDVSDSPLRAGGAPPARQLPTC